MPKNRVQRDAEIFKMRDAGETLETIGKRFGLSKQRVQQILSARDEPRHDREERTLRQTPARNKRVEIRMTPEQYEVLRNYVESEYIVDVDLPDGAAAIAEAIRDILSWQIPAFAKAKSIIARGKYDREKAHEKPTEALIEAYEEDEWMEMDGFYPPDEDEFDDDEDITE